MASYDTILVATDLSDPSLCAVQRAGELADCLGSRLVLTYVIDDRLPPLILSHSAQPAEEILEAHRRHAARALERWAAEHLPGRTVETVVRQGVVHDQIVELARERRAAMIVVGMHGHGYLGHALAGSTAERVLHHAKCPVLVVPE